ncbi:hypothetical protein D3C80_1104560 [compost metagenome]
MRSVFAGVVGDRTDRCHQRLQVSRLAATKTLEQGRAAQAEHGLADGAVGGRQQQALAVLEQLDENPAGTDHQGQAEVVLALDADDQLGQRRAGHGLEQQLIERDTRRIGADPCAHLLQRRAQGLGVAQVEGDGTGFGLVRQLRTDRLEHQRVADLLRIGQGLLRRAQHALGYRQAKRLQGLFRLPFVEQLALALQRLRAQRRQR